MEMACNRPRNDRRELDLVEEYVLFADVVRTRRDEERDRPHIEATSLIGEEQPP